MTTATPLASVAALHLDEDQRWIAVRRIIESPSFCKSPRLCALLLYLAEHSLLERFELLTEHSIASRVFHRDDGFDPGVDTIVRSHMVRLRQKLDQYAEENRETTSLRVIVPKGEYVVRFEALPITRDAGHLSAAPLAQVPASGIPRRTKLSPALWVTCVLSVAVVLLAARLVTVSAHQRTISAAPAPIPHPLWSRIFRPRQTTTFVAADSGLVMLHHLTARSTTLAEYLSRDFSHATHGLSPQKTDEALDMANRRYTSFVDMNMFDRIEHLPYASSGQLELKYARDLHMDDLKQGNIIFSGARGANPWLELYEPQMNFLGASDGVHHAFSFINRDPRSGEASRFSVTKEDPQQRVLGLLAFLANVDGSGNALIIEGNSMAGTEAISDFLFDDHALLPFLQKISRPDGTLPHFEVLLESTSINGSAGPFRIIAFRTHP